MTLLFNIPLFLFLTAAISNLDSCYPDQQDGIKQDSIISGKVIGVTDGDTFVLFLSDSTSIKIRLASIDCPERKQPFSARAKQFTSDAIFGKTVEVEIKSKDRYGRYIANVNYGKKKLADELLINGLAWHFTKYSDDSELKKLEILAKENKIGLWSGINPIPPWEWRKGIRN